MTRSRRVRSEPVDGRGLQPQDEDGKLICLLCAGTFEHLGRHVSMAHRMPITRYKEQFELPAGRGLVGRTTRAKMVAQARHLLATNPRVREGFQITDAKERRRRLRKAAAGTRRFWQRAGWVANRRRGPDPAARARHEYTALTLGYDGLVDMLNHTWHLPRKQVANMLGLATLYELYGRYDDLPNRPAGLARVRSRGAAPPVGRRDSQRQRYDQIAQRLGYGDIVQTLAAHQHLTNEQLAQLLGIAVPTASHVRQRYAPHLVDEHQRLATRKRGDRLARDWREHYDQFAKTIGYKGIDNLIDTTRHLTHREVADIFGLSARATAEIRRRYGTTAPAPKANTGRRHDVTQIARDLGHRHVNALLLKATADLSNSQLADYLGVSYGTAWRLRTESGNR